MKKLNFTSGLNYLKLLIRAYKYKNKNDRGGISYILTTVRSGDTAIDIGAHKAGYIYFMLKKIGKSGQVHAFEPQNNLFNKLNELKKSLQWANVFISNTALSDITSNSTLHIPVSTGKFDSPGASIVNLSHINQQTVEQEVKTETLDEYCAINKINPSFLKIDVEGNELKVLKGGLAIIQSLKPKILIESEQRHIGREGVQEVFDFLSNLGYNGRFIKINEYIPLSDFDFDKHQGVGSKPYCNNFIFEYSQ